MSRTLPARPNRGLLFVGLIAALVLAAPAGSASADTSPPPASPGSTPSATPSTPSPSATPDPNSVTFGVTPADAKGGTGQAAFNFGGTPGSRLSNRVAVLNYSTKPLTVRLVAVDALNTNLGGISGVDLETQNTDIGKWILLPPTSAKVTVPPRDTKGPGAVIVPFSLTVPTNATPGDHTGLILAVLSSSAKDANGANIQLQQRVGTRVYMTVTGDLAPGLTVTDLQAEYQAGSGPLAAGTMNVSYTVTNTGNVRFGGAVNASVEGLSGGTAFSPPQIVQLLLPGNSVRMTSQIDGVTPAFRETVSVVLHPVRPSAGQSVPLADVEASTTIWVIPWLLIALVIALLLVLAIAILMIRRRRGNRGDSGSSPGRRQAGPDSGGRGSSSEPKGRREAPTTVGRFAR